MARLIDANPVIEKLKSNHDLFVDAYGGFGNLPEKDKARVDEISSCIAELFNAPTVDAVEVVHGRWEPHPMLPAFVRCSACRDCITYDEWPDGQKWKYCPHCGARMDK